MWGAAISAVGSLAGGLMSNSAKAKEASRNRDFQERMSSTAHQREVEDLRLAGLNPILSGTGGQGASQPSGSQADQQDVITPAINSAVTAFRTYAEVERLKAEAEKIKAEAYTEGFRPQMVVEQTNQATSAAGLNRSLAMQSASQDELNQAMKDKVTAEKALVDSQKLSEDARRKILGQDLLVAVAEAKRARTEGQIDDSTYGKVMRYIDRLKNAISPWSPNQRGQAPRIYR